MRKRILFLTILLLGFQLVFTEPSWPTEINENNKLLVSVLKDLQWTIIEKIEYNTDTTATAFADAQNIERDLSLKDIFRTPLVIIEETINTIGSLINARRLSESAQQVFDSSETNLQIVSGIMTISTLKQVGKDLQLAIDGPTYSSNIEKMLDKAYNRSSTRLWFNPDAYKTVIKDYLYAQYEPGPLRIPHKTTDLTRKNLEIASGTYEIERSIRQKFRTLIDNLENNPLSSDSALEATNQVEKIKRAIVASKGSYQKLSYETYLKDETGSYILTRITDLELGSIAQSEKMCRIALANSDREMKIEQIITISRATRAIGQAIVLHLHTTYKSPETGEILGEVQKWSLVPSMIEVGISKVFDTNAREQINMIPQEMMMTLPLELSNVWMVADDTVSYVEYLIKSAEKKVKLGIVRGRAVDALSGDPVWQIRIVVDGKSTIKYQSRTYRLTGVEPGSYTLKATAPNYYDFTKDIRVERGGEYVVDIRMRGKEIPDLHNIMVFAQPEEKGIQLEIRCINSKGEGITKFPCLSLNLEGTLYVRLGSEEDYTRGEELFSGPIELFWDSQVFLAKNKGVIPWEKIDQHLEIEKYGILDVVLHTPQGDFKNRVDDVKLYKE